MKKYGLLLRSETQLKKQKILKPPSLTHLGFGDDGEVDVEKDISRQANNKKAFRDIEEQHKKALEDDPSIFDYDAVYDEMKMKEVLPRAQDRQERKPKYIQKLIEKAKVREQEQEIVYDRKLAKERSVEDHLYSDKDKFVTNAYKKKLAEQTKWMEKERISQLREERDDVTKKKDISDFYFNLSKNIAFGGDDSTKKTHRIKEVIVGTPQSSPIKGTYRVELLIGLKGEMKIEKTYDFLGGGEKELGAAAIAEVDHKRDVDHVAAAKERFLARKRSKI